MSKLRLFESVPANFLRAILTAFRRVDKAFSCSFSCFCRSFFVLSFYYYYCYLPKYAKHLKLLKLFARTNRFTKRVRICRPGMFIPGDFIVRFGDRADRMFFLENGFACVEKTEARPSTSDGDGDGSRSEGKVITLAILTAGDCFGESALMPKVAADIADLNASNGKQR